MAFIGSGKAKLILFGEHAVVHGYPAVGTSLPGQLTVKWTPGSTPLALDCPEEYQPAIRLAFQRIAGFFDLKNSNGIYEPAGENSQALPGGILEFQSDIPVSSGLGSSGAVCVAMAGAVAAYVHFVTHTHAVADIVSATDASSETAATGASRADESRQTDIEDKTIWAAAHEGEQVFHGRPSGVDTGLALWGRLCQFTPQPQALPSVSFLPRAGIELVYGTVPREASCAANVAAIGKAMAAGDTGVSAILAVLGHLSSQAAVLLAQSTVLPDQSSSVSSGLGILANTAMDLLRDLGLSTSAMDTILSAGLAAGATGGKLSGGGAGGAFWLACPSADDAIRIQTAVTEEARRISLPGNAFTGVITI
jgi:mevalonate kinase